MLRISKMSLEYVCPCARAYLDFGGCGELGGAGASWAS